MWGLKLHAFCISALDVSDQLYTPAPLSLGKTP